MKTLFTHEEWALLQSIYELPAMNTELAPGATGHIEDHKRIAEYISYFPSRPVYSYIKTADNEWTIYSEGGSAETTADQWVEDYIEGSVQEGFVSVLGRTTPKGVSASELPIGSEVTLHTVGARLLRTAIETASSIQPFAQQTMSQMADLTARIEPLEDSNGTLNTTVSDLEADVSTLTADKETLEGKVSTLESDNSSLSTTVSTLESDSATLNTTVSTLEGNVATLTSDKEALEGQVSTLESTIGDLTTRLEALEAPGGEV